MTIAKNTLFLYMRTFVSIVVNVFAVRVLWQALGVDDFGIYNVVGGIVTMFAFLNSAMAASSQRFISFELGKGNLDRLKETFSVSVKVHVIIALIVLFLAETVGLWFLNYRMNIPTGRYIAANWVYQCSIISFLVSIISVPYNACIIAHEHMKAFGYFGILDIFLKLAVSISILFSPIDKLILYSILILLESLTMRIIYGLYCRKHFPECFYVRCEEKVLEKEMFSFAGWSFIGNMGFSVRDQGVNIVLNLFFNVAVNAAKGIANQVGGLITGFASNFTMALNPQITKRYAVGEIESMLRLIFNGGKYSIMLLSFVVIPFIVCAPAVLRLWLGDVAPYTVGFLRLILIMAMVDCVVSPIITALQATGKIKKFQIVVSLIMAASIPLSWLWLKFDLNPYVVIFACIFTSVVALVSRLMLLHELIAFSYLTFFLKVYSRTIPCFLFGLFISWWIYGFFPDSIIGLLGFIIVSVSVISFLSYFFVLTTQERIIITDQLRGCLSRITNIGHRSN